MIKAKLFLTFLLGFVLTVFFVQPEPTLANSEQASVKIAQEFPWSSSTTPVMTGQPAHMLCMPGTYRTGVNMFGYPCGTATVNKVAVPLPGAFTASASGPACSGNTMRVTMNWTASSGATSYQVFFDNHVLATTSSGTRSYTHHWAVAGGGTTSARYTVVAQNSGGKVNSNTMTVRSINCSPAPAPTPTSSAWTPSVIVAVSATCSGSNVSVTVNWLNGSSNTRGTYKVFQGNTLIATKQNATSHTYTTSLKGQSLTHRVDFIPQSLSSLGTTLPSKTHTVTTPTCIPKPGSFTLSATPSCSSDNKSIVNLTWTQASSANGYTVYRDIGSSAQAIGSKSSPLSIVDQDAPTNKSVTYFVKANNSTGATDSNQLSVITNDCRAPLVADVALSTEKEAYQQGEQVRFILLNNGPDAVEVRSLTPFDISSGSDKVFTPSGDQATKIISDDNSESWHWNQLSDDSSQVPVGDYSVTVYYFLDNEQKSATAQFEIVAAPEEPAEETEINFTVTPSKGFAPLSVVATSLSDGNQYKWDFGDGTVIENGDKSENHVYVQPGTYTLTLTIGDKSASKTVVVEAVLVPADEFSFVISPDYGATPLDVNGAIVSECNESITWNWGDGTIDANAEATNSHRYTKIGTHTATVSCGSESLTKTITVVAPTSGSTSGDQDGDQGSSGEQSASGPSFSLSASSGNAPFTVTATITSECNESITWNWGDGTIDTNSTMTKSHTYTTIGTYTVIVSCGDESATRSITVVAAGDKIPSGQLPDTGNSFFNFLRPIWNFIEQVF